MNPWFGKIVLLLGLVVSIAIRVPHDAASKKMRVAESRKGPLEVALLAFMMLGTMLLPIVFVATPLLAFADYALSPVALGFGVAALVLSQWLFYRSHADLGKNWSMTLEIRDEHALVTSGVYARIRHPMYAAIFGYAIAQALLLPNWIAGPACLVAFSFMFAVRLRTEERMMLERFGEDYERYRARTKRIVPLIF
jgi:protein-S-isoprenylcysteine O-methyltransferase Ste14